MAKKMPDYNSQDEQRIALAVEHLRTALRLLAQAQCPKVAARVRAAISSAKGAARAVGYRRTRSDMAELARIRDCPCAQSMRCLCAGHARGNPASAPCDTSER